MQEIADNMGTIVMDRYTQFKANFPAIKEPRWRDNTILISADIGTHNKVICIYTKADGSRMFPEPLYVSERTAKKYRPFDMPTGAGGIKKLRAIPVHEFQILQISQRSIHDY